MKCNCPVDSCRAPAQKLVRHNTVIESGHHSPKGGNSLLFFIGTRKGMHRPGGQLLRTGASTAGANSLLHDSPELLYNK